MTSYVVAELRRFVVARATRLCEYCLIHEEDVSYGCQVDHVVAEKHGGLTIADNLSLACAFCNRAKGSDIGSITDAGTFVRFFNPRSDVWSDHFALHGATIVARTPIGAVTARILEFNAIDRILEREVLQQVGRYPSQEAMRRISEENSHG